MSRFSDEDAVRVFTLTRLEPLLAANAGTLPSVLSNPSVSSLYWRLVALSGPTASDAVRGLAEKCVRSYPANAAGVCPKEDAAPPAINLCMLSRVFSLSFHCFIAHVSFACSTRKVSSRRAQRWR